MRLIRAIALAAFALLPAPPAAPGSPVQACGGGFIDITVVDPAGGSVRRPTIELVAEAPPDYPLRSANQHLTSREAEEIIGQHLPMNWREDRCGNPLKQVARSTKVRKSPSYGRGEEFGVKNFGYCTMETRSTKFVLKVSAPGYVTDYYLGPYLGGCSHALRIVLAKAEEGRKKSTH